MGLIYADITLKSPRHPELKPLQVRCMADSGAITLVIPQHVANRLRLEALESRPVRTPDGKEIIVPYVGPVHVLFENRQSFAGAFVMGDEVLLGAIQMEDMDLVLMPREQKLSVNPQSPNIATAIIK